MEDLENEEIVSKNETDERFVGEASQNAENPQKPHKVLKIFNIILFVLSLLCSIAAAVFLGEIMGSETFGKVIVVIVLFYIPIILLAVGLVSLLFNVFVAKKTKSQKWIMYVNIVLFLFDIVFTVLFFLH